MEGLGAFSGTVGVGIAVGVLALWLIASELGRRAGMSLAGRLALSAGLGMGVLAVGMKAAIVGALTHTDLKDLARTGMETRTRIESLLPNATDAEAEPHERLTRYSWHSWRALPDRVKGARPSQEQVALGRKLFNDPNLSADRTVSCASCHDLAEGGDDGLQYARGVNGQTGDRNAPTVLNAAFLQRLFWDGRAASLKAQAKGPLLNPVEMAMSSGQAVVARVQENPDYVAAFGPKITFDRIASAIAAYETTLITPDTPYDRFVRGDRDALTGQQLRGMALFAELGCRNCHTDPVFSAAGTVRGTGVYRRFPVYPGGARVQKYDLLPEGRPARWRVPSLRNVARTAPYLHNGAVPTLEEAIRIMVVSQLGRELSEDPALDIEVVLTQVTDARGQVGQNLWLRRDRAVSEAEIADIAAFLHSLSGDARPADVAVAAQ